MCTWDEIGKKWSRAQQMGWQAIQAAMDVGDELSRKKLEVPRGEWRSNLEHALKRPRTSANTVASQLMRLAFHRTLIEEHKPVTMRKALALLPKVPRKTSEEKLSIQQDEVDKYEEFAKDAAKDQAKALAKKMVGVELKRLQNEAHDEIMKELRAANEQLDKERKRSLALSFEADEKRKHYHDLVNKKMGGYDYEKGLKVLRQVAHQDRFNGSPEVAKQAMEAIKHISQFLKG